MKVANLQRARLTLGCIPNNVEVSNIYDNDGKKINLDGFGYKLKISELSDLNFICGKFLVVHLNIKTESVFSFLKSISDKNCVIEGIFGSLYVFAGNINCGEIKAFDLFSDCLKAFDYKKNKEIYIPNILMPELSPVPDEIDTRIVLHNKIQAGFAFGRVYRYFSDDDYKTLKDKFVFIEHDGNKSIALIRKINPDSKLITFEVIRSMDNVFEGNEDKYGLFEADIVDDYFDAYEYFRDAINDTENTKRFNLA